MLATILSFTAEEIWQEMRAIDPTLPESVFLSDFPKPDPSAVDDSLDALWGKVLTLRGAVSRALEELRAAKTIGTSLEAHVQVNKTEDLTDVASAFTLQEMADIAIVSKLEWVEEKNFSLPLPQAKVIQDEETGYAMAAAFTSGTKCPRCWKYSETPGEDGLCPRCAWVLKG
jgi:isoleucyl-tRNA synthetase